MFRLLAAVIGVALVLCAGPALAKKRVLTVNGSAFMTTDVPGSWKVSEIDRGLQIRSSDDEAYVWVESYLPSQREAVLAEHDRYFAKQGVKIKGDPTTQAPQKSGGKTIVYMEFDATWQGAPTLLRYALVDPDVPSGREVIVSYWASPKGSERFDEDVLGIVESLELVR